MNKVTYLQGVRGIGKPSNRRRGLMIVAGKNWNDHEFASESWFCGVRGHVEHVRKRGVGMHVEQEK